jgi:hypothetical protein
VPPNPINLYTYKRASDDIAALAKEVGAEQIILGGHDWYAIYSLRIRLLTCFQGRCCCLALCPVVSSMSPRLGFHED